VDADSAWSEIDSNVVPSARSRRGSGGSCAVASAPAPKKARASGFEVVCLSDSDASSTALSVATTQSALSGRSFGLAASAEDQHLGSDGSRAPFLHRAVAAAPAKPLQQKRKDLHPPHPSIAKLQVRRIEGSVYDALVYFVYWCIHVFMYSCIHVFMYLCIHLFGVFMYSCIHVLMGSFVHAFLHSCIDVLMYSCIHVFTCLAA
jgi:hypothetical protein